MQRQRSFICGGYNIARSAAMPAIRAQVIAELSDQFSKAGLWRRIWLWRQIAYEVERRVEKVAPYDALY